MLIRPSSDDDVARVAAIYGHYVDRSAVSFELEPPTANEIAARRSKILALGLPYLIAEDAGAVVGYAYASEYRPRPAYRFTVEDSVYVDPDYLSRGIGLALLSALIEACRRGPWKQMIAVIADTGTDASIRLHQRLGFRHAGRLEAVGFKFDQWFDTILMQRPLNGKESYSNWPSKSTDER